MRERANALFKGDSVAIFVTVNDIASKSFREALISSEDQARFDAWLISNEEGIFLSTPSMMRACPARVFAKPYLIWPKRLLGMRSVQKFSYHAGERLPIIGR